MACCDRRLSLGATESVCPTCLATVPAERFAEGDVVYLRKTCPEHGAATTPVWRGLDSYLRWGLAPRAYSPPSAAAAPVERGCPHDCGLCADHRQQTCCVLLEVTSRCDLACPVCYASATRHGVDASLDEIDGWLDTLAEAGGRVHIQLSGGEPTTRDDLPEIVARVRARGFAFVQLNTNGVRIARQPAYLAALAKAGLDCVFLQFDGVDRRRLSTPARREADAAQGAGDPKLRRGRRRRGADADARARRQCRRDRRHRRLRGRRHAGGARGAFPPVSYFGRCLAEPDAASRITLPEVMEALIAHAAGRSASMTSVPARRKIPIARSAAASSSIPPGACGRWPRRGRPAAACLQIRSEPPAAVRRSRAPTSRANGVTSRGSGRGPIAPPRRSPALPPSTPSSPTRSARSAFPAWRFRTPGRSISTGCASATSMSSRLTGASFLSAPIISPAATAARFTDQTAAGGRVSAATLDPWMAERMGSSAPDASGDRRLAASAARGNDRSCARGEPVLLRAAGLAGWAARRNRRPRAPAVHHGGRPLANDPPLLALSQSAIARVVTLETSGTSGPPKRLHFTPDDLESTVDFFHHGMALFTRPGDRVAIAFPGRHPGGIAAGLAVALRRLGAEPFAAPRRSIRSRSPPGCATSGPTSSPGRRFRCSPRRASPPMTAARRSARAPCC